ncbi:hypothetical protein MBLNU459_g0719t1 [Dothideomycetes sp. NU459]
MPSPRQSPRSSRASTPASSDEAFSKIVSPRSRIQALLAPFDEDSDDDLPPRSAHMPSQPPNTSVTRPSASRVSVASDSGDDEEGAPVPAPRGRLAARMAGTTARKQAQSASSDEDSHDVYQRIRKQLMTEKKTTAADATIIDQRAEQTTPSPPRRRLTQRVERLADSPASARSESPGLFMSPAPARSERADDSDSDSPLPDPSRLRELVDRRRKERLAKEAEQRDAEERRAESGGAPLSDLFNDQDDDEDEQTEHLLTQNARPTRKASKKALEEMNRETQRMSRNMQLAHQAKVKKRFTTADFLSRFNKPKAQSPLVAVTTASRPAHNDSSSAAPSSDVEGSKEKDTPPSSPPSEGESGSKLPTAFAQTLTRDDAALAANVSDGEDLPELQQLFSTQPAREAEKANLHAHILAPEPTEQVVVKKVKPLPKNFRVVPPVKSGAQSDSDDDLEIVRSRFPVFDNIPALKASESRSLLALRRLAHLNAPDKARLKKGEKPSMTPMQLELLLRSRAKEQADEERREKLEGLRARGIVVLTEEEREKEQIAFEDLLGKARADAAALREKEKALDKANGIEEKDMLASDDESEDGDYAGSEDEEGDDEAEVEQEEDVEISGSEEEDAVMADDANGLVDDEAGEDSEDSSAENEDETVLEEEEADRLQANNISEAPRDRRSRRNKRVIDDDDDEDDTAPSQQVDDTAEQETIDDLAAAFGFGPAPVAPMGVSQMFAGTMAQTQTQADSQISLPDTMPQDEDSMDVLRHIPSAPVPNFEPILADDSQDGMVVDSQAGNTQTREDSQQVVLHFEPPLHSPGLNLMSQISDIPDPSQDVGLGVSRTPLKFKAPPSTVDTVILAVPESPVVQKKGRLIRRADVGQQAVDEAQSVATPAKTARSNAFDVMHKAARKPAEPDFDKKKSDARNMVEEQAEESEDEYAGLGGASDDEGADIADEADRQMIDESDIKVDERQLAAYHAEKARVQDEAQTSKLYKDLVSGALRRKRAGGAFDLDSDEDEQIAERRRRRQREEARKRRLLLQDESIGKLGGNDKKEAFLRAIEDKDDDDELDILGGPDVEDGDMTASGSQQTESQSQEAGAQPLAQVSGNALKRQHSGDNGDLEARRKRISTSVRRSQWDNFRKPASIAEVRESVSFLIDEPFAGDAHNLSDLEDNDDREDHGEPASTERAPFAERRTAAKSDIIDRLTLKRISTTADSIEDGTSGKLAFAAPVTKSSFSSFKSSTLLRRATTNLSTDSQSMPPPALNRDDSSVRRGGSKKSSINYQAREAERRAVVDRAERKRQENVRKIAGMRRQGALGLLKGMSGGFE